MRGNWRRAGGISKVESSLDDASASSEIEVSLWALAESARDPVTDWSEILSKSAWDSRLCLRLDILPCKLQRQHLLPNTLPLF